MHPGSTEASGFIGGLESSSDPNHATVLGFSQGNSNTFMSCNNEGLLSSARCLKDKTLPFYREHKVEVVYTCVECCQRKEIEGYDRDFLAKIRTAKF